MRPAFCPRYSQVHFLPQLLHIVLHSRRNFTNIIKAIPGFKKMTEEEKKEILSYEISF